MRFFKFILFVFAAKLQWQKKWQVFKIQIKVCKSHILFFFLSLNHNEILNTFVK